MTLVAQLFGIVSRTPSETIYTTEQGEKSGYVNQGGLSRKVNDLSRDGAAFRESDRRAAAHIRRGQTQSGAPPVGVHRRAAV
jgi:hypothetical protein